MKLVTFETQTRREQTWRTIGIFDDRPAAVTEAERLLESRRTPAVRVIQVLYDPRSSVCTEYTVFRATCFDAENERSRARAADPAMFEWGEDGRTHGEADDLREDGRAHAGSGELWIDRHWPGWAPDWATTALALSVAVLIASIMFRWMH
ncbi:MAG TPA: hypothetical protein VE397_22820 [Stellaceae bacterium]|nr:hypothetical protein [Stellaceae bacterium]